MVGRREKTKRRQRAVRRAVISSMWGIALCALVVVALPALLSASGLANGADAPVKVTILPRTAAPGGNAPPFAAGGGPGRAGGGSARAHRGRGGPGAGARRKAGGGSEAAGGRG